MSTELQTFRDLIELWGGVAVFRADMGLEYGTAQKMHQRDSIAVRHWPDLIRKAQAKGIPVTPDLLVRMKENTSRGVAA